MIDITIPPLPPFSTGVTRHQLKKPSALKGQKAYFRGATLLHPSLREGLSFRGHKPTRSVLSSIPLGLITLPPAAKSTRPDAIGTFDLRLPSPFNSGADIGSHPGYTEELPILSGTLTRLSESRFRAY